MAAANPRPAVVNVPSSEKEAAKAEVALADSAFMRGLDALKGQRLEEARLLFEAAVKTTDIHVNSLSWLTAQLNECHTLCLQKKNREAEALARKIATTCEAELGLEDPLTSEALSYLAFVLKHIGHPGDAEPVYRRTVQVLAAKYGYQHSQVAIAMTKHGALLETLGRYEEAEAQHRQALGIMKTLGQESGAQTCIFLTNLAYCLHARNQKAEANQLMEEAYRIVINSEDSSLQSAGMVLRKQAEFFQKWTSWIGQNRLDIGRCSVWQSDRRSIGPAFSTMTSWPIFIVRS